MKKIIVVLTFLYVLVLYNIAAVSADSIYAPNPFTIEVEEGAKIVWITPEGENFDERNKDYPKSGLYYNENPLRNIYYFDDHFHQYNYYLHEQSFVYSDDGVYFVHIPWARQNAAYSTDGEAIMIYKNGAFFKSYTVGELVKDMSKAKFSESHVIWEKYEERVFDSKENILTVTTLDDIVISFDITTGEIVNNEEVPMLQSATKETDSPDSKSNVYNYIIVGFVAMCIVIIAGMCILALVILTKKRK